MTLEPLTVLHAGESFPHWQDSALYQFIPTNPPESEEALRARYSVLSRGGSSDGSEQWLNWFMRESATGELLGMIECTLFADKTAQLAYFVFAKHQRSGFAFEGCSAVLRELKTHWGVPLAQAYIDTRNDASIALVEKLGFSRSEHIEKADFFKGLPSDEYRFTALMM